MKKYDVVCIGTCILDISTCGLQFQTLLEQEPVLANSISYRAGGDASNQAVMMHRFGARVCLLTRLGTDFVGQYLKAYVDAQGVDVSYVCVSGNTPTAENNILIGEEDKKVYIISSQPNSRTEFCGADIDMDVLKQARLVSIGSLFVHPKLDRELPRILAVAKENGVIVSADVCPTGEQCDLRILQNIAAYLDFFFANEAEARLLSSCDCVEEMANFFLNLGIKTVVIKLGVRGSFVKSQNESLYCDAFPVKAVDTTGAGDNFAAGFLTAYLRGKSMQESARFASAASAIVVQNVGATAGAQCWEEVIAFMDAYTTRKK